MGALIAGALTAETWARVRVVSWDVDGTLYAMSALRRELRRLAIRRLVRLHWASLIRSLRTLGRLRRTLHAARTGPLDPALFATPAWHELSADWFVPAVAAAGPRPDLPALLDAIAASGRTQVVLSDLPATAKLDVLGLAGRFTHVFAGPDLGRAKPDPALFRHVLDTLALQPAELLHVGDRPDTDGGAAALGIPFLHVDALPDLTALLGPG